MHVVSSSAPNTEAQLVRNDAPAPGRWRVGTLTYTSAGLAVLFFWLLFGDFAWSMRDRSVGPMAQWYLKSLEVPNLLFGLLVSSFPAVVSLMLAPVISVRSDRHRGRLGRRIPFLLITTPLATFGMMGLAFTPVLAGWLHGIFPDQSAVVIAVACFGLFWGAFEVASIAGQAVFAGLINDVVPSALLGRFYGLFRAVSLIDGMIFNYWIMGKAPEHFTLILMAVGAFYCVAFLWVCFKVKEGNYPPPPKEEGKVGVKRWAHEIRTYGRECFSKPYYVEVFLMLTAANLAFMPVNIFAIPYAQSLGVNMDAFGKALALTYLISLGLAFFLGWLADAFHPLRMSIAALIGYLGVSLWGYLYGFTPQAFFIAFVLHGVFSGCYFTCAASIGQRLFPHEKFAQFASASAMVLALPNIALAPAVGLLIDGAGGSYRLTFLVACVLTLCALVCAVRVHIRFTQLGGPKHYVAPE